MENEKKDAAMTYLSQAPLTHMDMIVPIKRNTAHILYAAKDGVCLKETKSGAYMLSAASHKTGTRLLDMLPYEGLFTFHQGFMLDDFKAKVRYKTFIENYQAVYFGKQLLPVMDNLSLKPLDSGHFGTIIRNYDVDVGEDYIRKLLAEGKLFGGFVESCLIGFVGIHAEGSIGLLKVFDQHLKKGYGATLLGHITNYQLTHGVTPFAQIGVDNVASLAVFRKLGFSISDDMVYWMF